MLFRIDISPHVYTTYARLVRNALTGCPRVICMYPGSESASGDFEV